MGRGLELIALWREYPRGQGHGKRRSILVTNHQRNANQSYKRIPSTLQKKNNWLNTKVYTCWQGCRWTGTCTCVEAWMGAALQAAAWELLKACKAELPHQPGSLPPDIDPQRDWRQTLRGTLTPTFITASSTTAAELCVNTKQLQVSIYRWGTKESGISLQNTIRSL